MGYFLFATATRPALGPTEALTAGVKRSGREADDSPPRSARVKDAWSYNSNPPYIFMTQCLMKHRVSSPEWE